MAEAEHGSIVFNAAKPLIGASLLEQIDQHYYRKELAVNDAAASDNATDEQGGFGPQDSNNQDGVITPGPHHCLLSTIWAMYDNDSLSQLRILQSPKHDADVLLSSLLLDYASHVASVTPCVCRNAGQRSRAWRVECQCIAVTWIRCHRSTSRGESAAAVLLQQQFPVPCIAMGRGGPATMHDGANNDKLWSRIRVLHAHNLAQVYEHLLQLQGDLVLNRPRGTILLDHVERLLPSPSNEVELLHVSQAVALLLDTARLCAGDSRTNENAHAGAVVTLDTKASPKLVSLLSHLMADRLQIWQLVNMPNEPSGRYQQQHWHVIERLKLGSGNDSTVLGKCVIRAASGGDIMNDEQAVVEWSMQRTET